MTGAAELRQAEMVWLDSPAPPHGSAPLPTNPLQDPCNPLTMPPEASPKGMDVGSVLGRIFEGMAEAVLGEWCAAANAGAAAAARSEQLCLRQACHPARAHLLAPF